MKIILSFLIIFTLSHQVIHPKIFNSDEILKFNREADPEYKLKRLQWIEEMHRVEDGINWKIIEKENRTLKRNQRQQIIIENMKNNTLDKILNEEIIADGWLKGKWIEKGSNNQAGRIMTADIDSNRNLIYLISAGGNVWRSGLNGENWTCLNDRNSFGGSMIKVVKQNNYNRIIVASNSNFYYTEDEGLTWNEAKGFEQLQKWGWIVRAVMNKKNNVIYAIGVEWDWINWNPITVFYRSDDLAESFIRLREYYPDNSNFMDLWTDNSSVFFIHKDSVFILTEPSNDFPTPIIANFPFDITKVKRILMRGTNINGKVYLYSVLRTSTSPSEHFFISVDSGKTWDKRGTLTFGPFTLNSFAVSSIDSNMIFYGGVELFKSTDQGISWYKINDWWAYYKEPENLLHADIPAVDIFKINDKEELILISTDGGIYKSYDACETVKNISLLGLNVSQYYSVRTSELYPAIIYAGSQDQGFQRCTLDSATVLGFSQIISGDYGHIASSNGGITLWTVYPTFALLYQNAHNDQIQSYFWNFKGNGYQWLPPIVSDPYNPLKAYLTGGGENGDSKICELELVEDNIKHKWLDFNFASDGESKLASIAISKLNPELFFAITRNGKFYYSSDRGKNWTKNEEFSGPTNHYFYGTKILPSNINENIIFLGGSGYSNPAAFKSTDGGKTFYPINDGLPKTLIYDMALSTDEKFIFAATETGPYVYITDINRWFDMAGLNAPDQIYWSVEFIPYKNIVRFGTYGRGIWDFQINEITSVQHKFTDKILRINIKTYPNPAKDEITFEFDLPNETNGYIKIYTLDGKLIQMLDNLKFNSGYNEITLSLNCREFKYLNSGNFIAIFNFGGFIEYAKFQINK